MKLLSFVAASVMLLASSSYAQQKVGHNKEHSHVTEGKDHDHDEKHHGPHDHKAHHPDHKDEKKK